MTLRRPFIATLMLAALLGVAFVVLQQVSAHQTVARERLTAGALRQWTGQVDSFFSGLRAPSATHAVDSDGPATCATSRNEICWSSDLLPPQVDARVATAVQNAGATQATSSAFATQRAGCKLIRQPPGYPGNCTHWYQLTGGVVLVEIYPHRSPDSTGALTKFDGSEIIVQAIQSRQP